MTNIMTVTLNTAIDLFVEVEGLGLSETLLAQSSAEFCCGKGVNVARGLAALGQAVNCLGFVGRQSEAAFADLQCELVNMAFLTVDGKTRTNITLFDCLSHRETHIRTPGFQVTDDACERLLTQIGLMAQARDIVVLSGSLPPGAPSRLYGQLIEACRQNQAVVILDSSGDGLREAIGSSPWLIKPNLSELEELAGVSLTNQGMIIEACRALIERGVNWVCVSLGEQGAILVNDRQSWTANVRNLSPAVVTQVGCGDALVAGLAYARLNSYSPEDMLILGVSCAVANLFNKVPGAFLAQDVESIKPSVQCRLL